MDRGHAAQIALTMLRFAVQNFDFDMARPVEIDVQIGQGGLTQQALRVVWM